MRVRQSVSWPKPAAGFDAEHLPSEAPDASAADVDKEGDEASTPPATSTRAARSLPVPALPMEVMFVSAANVGAPSDSPVNFAALTSSILAKRSLKHVLNLSPSLLKSMLQKNCRLSRADAAVRCAVQLILTTSFLEFLRRFTIVIIEGK